MNYLLVVAGAVAVAVAGHSAGGIWSGKCSQLRTGRRKPTTTKVQSGTEERAKSVNALTSTHFCSYIPACEHT